MTSNHTTKTRLIILLAGLLALAPLGCRPEQTQEPADHPHEQAEHKEDSHPAHEDHGDHAKHAARGEEGHEDHDHGNDGGHGPSDLDRPIEELFAVSCEHGIEAHTCDDCRYEVGVARVLPELLEKGLFEVGQAVQRNFDKEIELTGEIGFNDRKIAHLGPQVAGVVRKVRVDVGEQVKAGKTLVELDSTELAAAESSFLEVLAEKGLAQKSFDRQKELKEAGISSEREFLETQQRLESASIQLDAARQSLVRLGHRDAKIKRLTQMGITGAAGKLAIVAPFDGEVLEMHAVRGERVEPGEEILLIGDILSLWLWVDLYETQLLSVSNALNEGSLPANVRVSAFPERRFPGRVDFVGRVMDKHTRTVKARIELDNQEGLLRPGMFANVQLGIDPSGGQVAVPSAALLADDGRDFVFVHHQGDYYVRRPVERGREVDGFIEIRGAIQAGDKVVTTGAFLLKSDVLRSKMGAGCAH